MKPRVLFPIRWKLLVPTAVLCAGTAYVGYGFLQNAWNNEYEKIIVEFSLKRLRSVSDQMESRLSMRYRELEGLCQKAYRSYSQGSTSGVSIFEAASSDLRKDVLSISFFRPEASGKMGYFQYVHWNLLKQKNLPRDLVDQINRKYPLNIRALIQSKETQFFNRSVIDEHGEPVSVVTLAFFGKGMKELEAPTLILADLRSDFLSKQDDAGELGEVFWMRRDGTLLAHPSASMGYRYAEKPMSHQARPLIESATAFGEHTLWEREGVQYLSSVVPTAMEDVFAVSEIPISNAQAAMKNLATGIGIAFLGLVSGLILFLTLAAGFITSRIRALEVALREVAQGYVPSKRLRFFDEFSALGEAIQDLATKTADPKTGFTPVKTATEAVSSVSVVPEELRFSEVLQVETTQIAFFQPTIAARNPATLWDVSRLGNQLWFMMGTAGGETDALPLVVQTTKKLLPGVRASKGKESVAISEQLAQLNKSIFEMFKGKAWLNITAVELNLSNGKMSVINAANEAPLIIPGKLGPNPEGTAGNEWLNLIEPKGLVDALPAVGSRADIVFKAWEMELQAKDAFCIFQKDALAAEQGPVSFRPEIRSQILKNGCSSAKALRAGIFNSPAKAKLQSSLMLAIVHFGAAAAATEKPVQPAAPSATSNQTTAANAEANPTTAAVAPSSAPEASTATSNPATPAANTPPAKPDSEPAAA